jgi:hypothetical protein
MKKIIDFFKRNKKDKKKMGKLYDISIHELDSNGNPIEYTETGVHADSREELIKIYKACDQKITILREYSDPDSSNAIFMRPETSASNNSNCSQINIQPPQSTQHTSLPFIQDNLYHQNKAKINEPPRYFNIGGVECKMENGKIYQKQWMRILGTEAGNYRLISDSNNREVSMNGKHLEVLKWVLIEDENENNLATSNNLICG